MTTPNPMASTYPSTPRAISQETHCIAGILTTIYGLEELRDDIKEVACLWLLHPRLQTQACMEPIASSTIHEHNERLRATRKTHRAIGLIAVSFDQRNHGTREVDALSNEAWRSGNERHAQDMFGSYRLFPKKPLQPTYLPADIPMQRRRNSHRHIPPPNLPPLLHLHAHNHPKPRPRHKSRRSRSMAMPDARPAHNNRHSHHWLSRLRPTNERPRTTIKARNMDQNLPPRLRIPRFQGLPPITNRSCRKIRPGRLTSRRRHIPRRIHLQPHTHAHGAKSPHPPNEQHLTRQTHPQPSRRCRQARSLQLQRTIPPLAENSHSTHERLVQRRWRRAGRPSL